jgi:hypothetical protein
MVSDELICIVNYSFDIEQVRCRSDWDDENDGEWKVPLIPNPDYQGPWTQRTIKNPNYMGKWKATLIDNPGNSN